MQFLLLEVYLIISIIMMNSAVLIQLILKFSEMLIFSSAVFKENVKVLS